MFTIFHLLALLGVIAGTTIGAMCGWHWFGWAGLIAGSIGGFIVGAMAGMFPLVETTAYLSRKLLPMTAEELRQYLHSDDCGTLNLVLLELNRRKEDISIELPFLYSQLIADNGHRRAGALAAMSSVFPELVELIPDYNPFDSTEDCREHTEPLKSAIAESTGKSAADAAESKE